MPTYEYLCSNCGNRFDVFQRFDEATLQICDMCGGALRKVYHPAGIVLRGSGFYRNDSRKAGVGSSGGSSEGSSSSSGSKGGSSGSGSKDAKPSTGSKDGSGSKEPAGSGSGSDSAVKSGSGSGSGS